MFTQQNDTQPVNIVEILPVKASQKDSHGEFDVIDQSDKKDNIVNRLTNHIEILATIGNLNHQHRNFSKIKDSITPWKMETKNENNITRVCLYEYSLFSQKPLDISEFTELRKQIKTIAEKCHQNLHLVLSSFAVELDNKILNCVIYVECGKEPILTTMAKHHTHSDKEYSYGKSYFSLTNQDLLTKYNISTESTFDFQTAGGIQVNAAIEICRDHIHGQAQASILRRLTQLEKGESKKAFSPLVTHILTSNSVPLETSHMLTDQITYVDPMQCSVYHKNSLLTLKFSDAQLVPAFYPAVLLGARITTSFKKSIKVSSPPFGKEYFLFTSAEYTVGKFTNEIILKKIDDIRLREPERLIMLEKQFSHAIKNYLTIKRNKSRRESIDYINCFFQSLKINENKTIERVSIMLGCLLDEAMKEQAKHSAQFFQKRPDSQFARLMVDIVKTFKKTEEISANDQYFLEKYSERTVPRSGRIHF